MVDKGFFGENKNVEFKREIPKKHEKFLKDVIAFSNCTGGKIILGIEDITNAVYGIGDVNPFKLSDDISNMISDACTPQISPDSFSRIGTQTSSVTPGYTVDSYTTTEPFVKFLPNIWLAPSTGDRFGV